MGDNDVYIFLFEEILEVEVWNEGLGKIALLF